MKISCCMIGKNEVNDVSNAIRSVIDKVYEVIFVDTGSTDGTVELIKKEFPKVKVYHYQWNDDFGAARNYGVSKAKGDFLFYIDCDEEFIGEFPTSLGKGIYNFEIKNIHDDGNYVVSVCSRLISNEKGVKFKGKIHEIFDSPNVKLPIYKFNYGHIVHYGYLSSHREKKNKSERNITALIKEHAEKPTTQNCFYLGQEYFIVKNYEKAVQLALEGINLVTDNPLDKTFSPLLYHLYLSCLVEADDEIGILAFEDDMIHNANNPECYIVLLQYYLKKDKEGKVLRYAFQSLKNINADSLPVKFIQKNITYVPYLALARYYILNKKDKLMGLYFLELAFGSGANDIQILSDIYNLLPKCERNLEKWEHYNTLLYNMTKDEKLIKDRIGYLCASKDLEKNKIGIEIANKMNTPEENEKLKQHLLRMNREDLVLLLKKENNNG